MTLLVDRGLADDVVLTTLLRLKARKAGFRPELDLIEPHPGQQAVLNEQQRFNVVCNGRRWGKSALRDHIAVKPAADGKTVFWFSVTFANLTEVWDSVRAKLAPYTLASNATLRQIKTWTGGTFQMFSLWEPVSVRGRWCDVAVIDEAAHDKNLEYTWQNVIRPTLIDRRGSAWFLSTPQGFNFFHTLWQRGQDGPHKQDGWKSWQRPSYDNPHVPRDEIDALIEGEGMSPEAVSQEILAQFVTGATRFFHPEWWLGSLNRYDPLGVVEHPTRVQARAVFWDTALKDKQENAYSAAVVLEVLADDRLVVREVWRGRPQFPDLVAQTERIAERWNFDGKLRHVVVEDKASGTSLVQTLAAQAPGWLSRLVRAFPVTGSKPERWAKAAVWCKKGGVLLPEQSDAVPWLAEFEEELFGVPHAPFLDQADAFAEGVIFFENYLSRWDKARRGETAVAA